MQIHDGLQTVVIEGHHSDSHSRSGTADPVRNVKVLAEAAGMVGSAMRVQDTTRKAEKQTCAVARANPGMVETRS